MAKLRSRSRVHKMSDKTYARFITLIGAVCGYVVIKRFLFPDLLTLRNALIQGFFVGYGLAVVTIEIVARIKMATINGWVHRVRVWPAPQRHVHAGRAHPNSSRPDKRAARG